MISAAALVTAFCIAGVGRADTYRVKNTNDTGPDSLRWAIEQANTHVGRDKIVFAQRLSGRVILPATPLPTINGNRTIIIGDTDDDGHPDIAVNGRKCTGGSGLEIEANYCTIAGLAITNFGDFGIRLYEADDCVIRSCHVGVNLAGTKPTPNGCGDILLDLSDSNTIGGSTSRERNLVGCDPTGVTISNGSHNVISANYFGLASDGLTPLRATPSGDGVKIGPLSGTAIGNVIGGTATGERNVFGGLTDGIWLAEAEDSLVAGNYIGIGADGNTLVPIASAGARLVNGARNNTIGGLSSRARNVIAGGAQHGVYILTTGTQDNRIQGNYFGMNAAGTERRRLMEGVQVTLGAGPQLIGGNRAKAGNYFVAMGGFPKMGVQLTKGGAGSRIAHNHFGVLPGGSEPGIGCGVSIDRTTAQIRNNVIAQADTGVKIEGATGFAAVIANTFSGCATGVRLGLDGRCNLGNVNNSSANDDGGNVFADNDPWHIYNDTPLVAKAEGNDFGTTSRSSINARIYDRRDDPSKGRVDFDPLIGGISPTGDTGAMLAVSGASALPAGAGGAEVVFTLSAPADVTVSLLNIAGRPVATVARERATETGTRRVVWSGQTLNGTPAPAGIYVVRIDARRDDGQQARALCTLRLQR